MKKKTVVIKKAPPAMAKGTKKGDWTTEKAMDKTPKKSKKY